MYKYAAIVFLVCFSLYLLFTRVPDYFEAEFTPGLIVQTDTSKFITAVSYPVGKKVFTASVNDWGSMNITNGDKVTVIYNPTFPEEGSLYTFFAYWLKLPELIICALIFILLFASSIFITGNNANETPDDTDHSKRRKYKD